MTAPGKRPHRPGAAYDPMVIIDSRVEQLPADARALCEAEHEQLPERPAEREIAEPWGAAAAETLVLLGVLALVCWIVS